MARQPDSVTVDAMTTYSIRETTARRSEILRDLDRGGEVIITRQGRPCGLLTALNGGADEKPPIAMFRSDFS